MKPLAAHMACGPIGKLAGRVKGQRWLAVADRMRARQSDMHHKNTDQMITIMTKDDDDDDKDDGEDDDE